MNRKIIRRVIKASARQNMSGNWLRSFLLICLSGIISIAITSFLPVRVPAREELEAVTNTLQFMLLFIPREITVRMVANVLLVLILFVFVMAPFSVGIKRFYIAVSRTGKGKLSDAFSVFTDMKLILSSVWLNVLMFAVVMFWGILFMLLPIFLLVLSYYYGLELLASLSALLIYASIVLAVVWTSRYDFAAYILADGGKGAYSSFRECLRLMKKNSGECMTLRASYFLWDFISSRVPILILIYNSLFATVYAKYLDYMNECISFEGIEKPLSDEDEDSGYEENSPDM